MSATNGRPLALGMRALALLLLAIGASSGVRAGWLHGKATLAQHLLESAWRETRASGVATPPWPWADIAPVARLEVPGHGIRRTVLQDASGEAMAFGPGLVAGRPERAARAAVVLGGHRDSHLGFLEHLDVGAPLVLEDRNGVRHAYRLAERRVLDSRDGDLAVAADRAALVLVTCWPFRATQTGGPLRLVAIALPAAPRRAASLAKPARALATEG